MAIKDQFKTMKNNWLTILVSIAVMLAVLWFWPTASFTTINQAADQGYGGADRFSGVYKYAPELALSSPAPSTALTETARKVITAADINTKVESGEFLQAEQKLKSVITATSSLLLQENIRKLGEDKKSYHVGRYTIKVESAKLDAVATQLKEIGTVESFTQKKDDITESYQNLEIEINTEQQRLARYQKILEEAKTVEDKIKLNDHIFAQERRIQYLKDALTNADKQLDYSTIHMEITEKKPAFAELKWIDGAELATGFANNVSSAIYLFVVLLPYAAITLLIWLAIKWVRKSTQKGRKI